MKTTRIYFQDASFTDIRASDIQTDEFYRWLRFSSQRDTFKLPGMKQQNPGNPAVGSHEKGGMHQAQFGCSRTNVSRFRIS